MKNILIIDDEPAVIELVEAKLKTSGYETSKATNGREGLDAAAADKPDLILLDILMPEIDGFEVCRRLKADKETCDIPVIFLSGKLLERDVIRGLELGAVDYIIKPFSPRELAARVKRVIESKGQPGQVTPSPVLAHLEHKIEALSALQNVSAAMNSMRDMRELRQYILEQALAVARAKTGSLMMLDKQNNLRIANAKGLSRKIVEQTRIKSGEGISGSVASIGEPLLITNIEEDNRFRRQSDTKYETRSLVCVPLKARDRTIGVLNVNNKESGDIFDQDDLEILTLLANQAAIATDNADLYERMNTNLAQYEALKKAISTALEGHSIAEMINALLNQATSLTGASVGLLFLNDETKGELYVDASVGTVDGELGAIRVPLGEGLLGKAATTKSPVLVNKWNGEQAPLRLLRNLIGQPLTANNTLFGLMAVADKRRGETFSAGDLASLKSLSDQVVSVLYTSRIATQGALTETPAAQEQSADDPDHVREFCSVVAHELREPLTSIRGFSEMLIDNVRTDDGDSRRYLEIINSEAARMAKLIEDLLNISKLEAGQTTLNLRPASLSEVITETLGKMRQLSDFDVKLNIPDDMTPALIDRDRISQVLINLLSNAANYSQPGQPINITVLETADKFILTVADTGLGIAARDRARVFEKFFRADSETNRGLDGAGLGLAITKRLVLQHGGEIGVESTLGRGSKFWFTLPKGMSEYR